MIKKITGLTIVRLLALCLFGGMAFADAVVNTRVYTLNGTTGFGMAGMIAENENKVCPEYTFTVETDPSVVTAALVSGDCDIAALPTNAAAALYNKTGGAVQVLALNTRGVLYLVTDGKEKIESIADLNGKTVYAPAQNPSFIFAALCSKSGIELDIDTSYAQPAELNAAVAAGINALSGPLHGGSTEAVRRQLAEIRESGKTVREFVNDAKAEHRRISGLGHRVYKSYDPRAAIAKSYLEKIMAHPDSTNVNDADRQLFDIALQLEDIALSDDYFVSRHLYPNVDFYTGLIYRAIGFDPSMFTTLFALGRIPGWIAQYCEMLDDPMTKIGRPRQVYTGVPLRDYVPMEDRA